MPCSGTNRPDSDSRFHASQAIAAVQHNVAFHNPTILSHSQTCLATQYLHCETSTSNLSFQTFTYLPYQTSRSRFSLPRGSSSTTVPCIHNPRIVVVLLGAHTRVHRLYQHQLPIGRIRSQRELAGLRWHIQGRFELLE